MLDGVNASEAIQILVNLSVLAGLILLVYELHQNRQFARFQFIESRTANFLTFEQSMSNPETAAIWVKAITNPGSLELSEIRLLDMYLVGHFQIWRSRWKLELAGLADPGSTKQTLDADIPFYLGNTFGKTWWQSLRSTHSAPETKRFDAIIDEILADVDSSVTIDWFQRMKNRLAEDAGGS